MDTIVTQVTMVNSLAATSPIHKKSFTRQMSKVTWEWETDHRQSDNCKYKVGQQDLDPYAVM